APLLRRPRGWPRPPAKLGGDACMQPGDSLARELRFADLDISRSVVEALHALDPRAVPYPEDGHRRCVRRTRSPRPVPDRIGKTLAFGVPLVDLLDPAAPGPQALILGPTRELASQDVEDLIARGDVELKRVGFLVLDEADRMLRRRRPRVA